MSNESTPRNDALGHGEPDRTSHRRAVRDAELIEHRAIAEDIIASWLKGMRDCLRTAKLCIDTDGVVCEQMNRWITRYHRDGFTRDRDHR